MQHSLIDVKPIFYSLSSISAIVGRIKSYFFGSPATHSVYFVIVCECITKYILIERLENAYVETLNRDLYELRFEQNFI